MNKYTKYVCMCRYVRFAHIYIYIFIYTWMCTQQVGASTTNIGTKPLNSKNGAPEIGGHGENIPPSCLRTAIGILILRNRNREFTNAYVGLPWLTKKR